MKIIHLLDSNAEPQDAVRKLAEEFGLRVTSDGRLRTYPGSSHWHLKRGQEAGTLEVTHWPQKNRVWVSYHTNRATVWVMEMARLFAQALAEHLGGHIGEPWTD